MYIWDKSLLNRWLSQTYDSVQYELQLAPGYLKYSESPSYQIPPPKCPSLTTPPISLGNHTCTRGAWWLSKPLLLHHLILLPQKLYRVGRPGTANPILQLDKLRLRGRKWFRGHSQEIKSWQSTKAVLVTPNLLINDAWKLAIILDCTLFFISPLNFVYSHIS